MCTLCTVCLLWSDKDIHLGRGRQWETVFFSFGSRWFAFKSKHHGDWFFLCRGGGSNTSDWRVDSQSQKNLCSWPSNCPDAGIHHEPNQPPADVLSLNMSDFLFKKHISSSAPDSEGSAGVRWAVLRDPQSTHAGFSFLCSPDRGVPVGVRAVFLCLKTLCQCESQPGSPELSAGCGSPEYHVPYITQNQYLTSCSPRTQWHTGGFFFSWKQRERLQFESVRWARAIPTAALLFLLSSSILLLFSLQVFMSDPLGLQRFSAECSIKSTNFISLSLSPVSFLCV